jgi:hypothetical protein
MMASVSGRRISMRCPGPGCCDVTEPRSASMLRRTTSMPTPRPLRLVTFSAVEKPGSKIRFRMSASGGVTPRSTRPRSQARCQHLVALDAAAVVADADQDAARLVAGRQRQPALGRLAGGQSLLGRLQAVVQPVAHQVHQRVGDALDHRLVEFGLAADDLQRDVLAELGGGVAHHAAEAREGLADRHHAQLQRAVADFLDQPADLLVGLDQRAAAGLAGQQRGAGAGDHQLAQQVDHGVEPVGLHADEAVVLVGRGAAAGFASRSPPRAGPPGAAPRPGAAARRHASPACSGCS